MNVNLLCQASAPPVYESMMFHLFFVGSISLVLQETVLRLPIPTVL